MPGFINSDMSRATKQHSSHAMKNNTSSPTSTSQNSHFSFPRYSYYQYTESRRNVKLCSSTKNPKVLDTHFPESPRRSSKTKDRSKTIYKPSIRVLSSDSATCSFHYSDNSVHDPSPTQFLDYPLEGSSKSELNGYISSVSDCDAHFTVPYMFNGTAASPWSSSCSCRFSSSAKDIIIDMNYDTGTRSPQKLDGIDTTNSESEQPPKFTKPAELDEALFEYSTLRMPVLAEKTIRIHRDQRRFIPRKSSASSTGIKLRANSPKLAASRKFKGHARKNMAPSACKAGKNSNLHDSFAVVKSSFDPERDFRDSMMEMIMENNIQGSSKDLEDLLACYLSMNSKEYQDLIVKAFEQVWFDMAILKL